jgi:hypothetical protein
MSKIITRRTANKVTTQKASTLTKKMRKKGEAIVFTDIAPRFINLEEKYGHKVINIGSKAVEITPISEIRPLSVRAIPKSKMQNVIQRKKRFEMLKESLMKYAKNS